MKINLLLVVALVALNSCVTSGVATVKKDQAYYNYESALERAEKSDDDLEKELRKENRKKNEEE